MKYSEILANRVREALIDIGNVTEKPMFGGLCFMVDDKMCICIRRDGYELMCRVGPDEYETAVEKNGVLAMVHGGKAMKGYIYIEEDAIGNNKDFDYWINASLAYNKIAKPAKKRK